MPKISVVMAAYNAEFFIANSIESIINQTYKNIELIILDDNSTDSTLGIIDKYANCDARIKVVSNNPNLGPAKTRNKGIKLAESDFIAINDADDISLPTRLQTQIAFLNTHPEIFLVGSSAIIINEQGSTTGKFDATTSPEEIDKTLLSSNPIYHSSVLFRKTGAFQEYYRSKMAPVEDYDFYLRAKSLGLKFANLPEYLIKYRVYNSSISHKSPLKTRLLSLKAKEFFHDRLLSGTDSYKILDIDQILNTNFIESRDPEELEVGIRYFIYDKTDMTLSLQLLKKLFTINGITRKWMKLRLIHLFYSVKRKI